MKVTKYPQSCLLIEKGQTRIVIDPGTLFTADHNVEELGKIDAVLYTHQHPDHFDESLVAGFIKLGVSIYANEATAELVGAEAVVVRDGDSLVIGDFEIEARELPHMPLISGAEGPQNTGYIIDGTFFHPGDGISIQGLTVNDLAAPLAGPGISPKQFYDFIKQVNAKRVLPIHNDYYVSKSDVILGFNEQLNIGIEWVQLANGESAEL